MLVHEVESNARVEEGREGAAEWVLKLDGAARRDAGIRVGVIAGVVFVQR